MRISHLLAGAAFLATAAATGAIAEPHGWGGPGGPGGDEITRGIDLTDAQKAQIKSIHSAARTQARATMKELFGLHEQIHTGLLTAGTTEADLTPLVEKEQALRAALDKAHLETELQVRNVLTPDQLTKAASLHAQMKSLHEQEHALVHESTPE